MPALIWILKSKEGKREAPPMNYTAVSVGSRGHSTVVRAQQPRMVWMRIVPLSILARYSGDRTAS